MKKHNAFCDRYKKPKKKYKALAVALFDLAAMKKNVMFDDAEAEKLNAFKCKHCNKWHIGKKVEEVV